MRPDAVRSVTPRAVLRRGVFAFLGWFAGAVVSDLRKLGRSSPDRGYDTVTREEAKYG